VADLKASVPAADGSPAAGLEQVFRSLTAKAGVA
jgi:hypothetical protein